VAGRRGRTELSLLMTIRSSRSLTTSKGPISGSATGPRGRLGLGLQWQVWPREVSVDGSFSEEGSSPFPAGKKDP
jgi:hypothetical protein